MKATSSVAATVAQERDAGALGVWGRERLEEAYGSETLLINRNDETFDEHWTLKSEDSGLIIRVLL